MNCNIRQLVDFFSFLMRKCQTSEDYSTSDRRKLDMEAAVYRFSISYLVLELQSFKDAKIKDTKHAILVTSHTLNKYLLDS